MPVPPINRRTVVRGDTTFPKVASAPLDAQDSYLEPPPADASKLADGVAGGGLPSGVEVDGRGD